MIPENGSIVIETLYTKHYRKLVNSYWEIHHILLSLEKYYPIYKPTDATPLFFTEYKFRARTIFKMLSLLRILWNIFYPSSVWGRQIAVFIADKNESSVWG